MGGFLFGKKGKPSGPYQGPEFGQQESMLSNAVMGNMAQQQKLMGNIPQGFQQAGQKIEGQMTFDPMTYKQSPINFSQRNPYQYSQPQSISMPDIYTPQYQMAEQSINNQAAKTQEQMLAELNSRGMLTSGAANKAVMDLANEKNNRLSDLASQYSIEQGRMGLQEQQMRRQMEMERQYQQAAEIFRQQGASDEQAQFLAQQSLAGFNANLQGRQQAIDANFQGRQQALQEEQLANLIRRQPLDDLMKLYSMQVGQVGEQKGSPGLFGSLLSAGAGAATNFGLSMI